MREIVINENRDLFARIPHRVLKDFLHDIGTYGYTVYSCLVMHEGFATRETCVSIPRIARLIKCSERTVMRSLADLERVGLIGRRESRTPGITTVYIIKDLTKVASFPPVKIPAEYSDKAAPNAPAQKSPVTPEPVVDTVPTPDFGAPTPDSGDLTKYSKNKSNNKTAPSELFDPAPGVSKEPPMRKTITDEITRLWEIGNPDVKCEWVPLAFKRLKTLVESRPRWTTEQWLKCVRNRFSSDGINVGDAPESFIPQLPKYIRSPLNEYGKEATGGSNGSRGDKNRAAVDEVLRELDDVIERGR